jgi:hypothetical protein
LVLPLIKAQKLADNHPDLLGCFLDWLAELNIFSNIFQLVFREVHRFKFGQLLLDVVSLVCVNILIFL